MDQQKQIFNKIFAVYSPRTIKSYITLIYKTNFTMLTKKKKNQNKKNFNSFKHQSDFIIEIHQNISPSFLFLIFFFLGEASSKLTISRLDFRQKKKCLFLWTKSTFLFGVTCKKTVSRTRPTCSRPNLTRTHRISLRLKFRPAR